MNQFLETAINYAEAGIKVLPLVPRNKNPLSKHGATDATTNEETIKNWWAKTPNANVGIAMGKESGLFGLDIDYKDGADKNFLKKLPPTVLTITPTGGHHAFFKYPEGGIKNGLVLEKGVTVRSDGYYFAAPPSIHPEVDAPYLFKNGTLYGNEVSECPEWILEKNKEELEKKTVFKLPEKIKHGNQHMTLFKLGSSLRAKGMGENEILSAFVVANDRLEKPAPVKNLEKLAHDVCNRYEPGPSDVKVEVVGEIDFPDKDKKRVKGTIENLKTLLKELKIEVCYNEITKDEEIIIPGESFTVDNRAVASYACITSECNRYGLPLGNLSDHLSKIADQNIHNPVKDWVEEKPWDGESRLKDMFDTVDSPTKLKEALMKKWFISAIAAIYEPKGISAHGVLVFKGKQYIGKTKWFKNLAPQRLNVLKDGATLHPDNKDSVLLVITKWLVELGELDATFRKSDIAQLKAFLTKDEDIIRRPFAKKESHYPRRTVFFASVNEHYFLNDPTGNRRFWTIECNNINYDHCIDMQQFWAEIKTLYDNGESWLLTPEEINHLNESNETFQQMDPIEEKIRDGFYWDSNDAWTDWQSATEVCKIIGIEHPNQQQAKKAGSYLRKLIKEPTKVSKGLVRFNVPPRKTT